jgi:hypothetical protein
MLRIFTYISGFIAFVLLAFVVSDLLAGEDVAATRLIAPSIWGGISYGCWRMSKLVLAGGGPSLPQFAGWTFITIGAVLFLCGLYLASGGELGALAMSGMGIGFAGLGYGAMRAFETPEGKKKIVLQSISAPGFSRMTYTYVDEDTPVEDLQRKRASWTRQQIAERPDWASGRIESLNTRNKNTIFWIALVWAVIMVVSVIAVVIREIPWFALAFEAFIGAVILHRAGRTHLHRRKFKASTLELTPCPAHIGEALEGRIETGIAAAGQKITPCKLVLLCEASYETSRGSGSDRETYVSTRNLWRKEYNRTAEPAEDVDVLVVPFDLDIPRDAQASTLGDGLGVKWTLSASVDLPGLDWTAEFDVPVVAKADLAF